MKITVEVKVSDRDDGSERWCVLVEYNHTDVGVVDDLMRRILSGAVKCKMRVVYHPGGGK